MFMSMRLPLRVRGRKLRAKAGHRYPKVCIRQVSLRESFIGSVLRGDGFGNFVVRVDQRIAAGLFLDAFDEDARIVKAHVLRSIRAFELARDHIISRGLQSSS